MSFTNSRPETSNAIYCDIVEQDAFLMRLNLNIKIIVGTQVIRRYFENFKPHIDCSADSLEKIRICGRSSRGGESLNPRCWRADLCLHTMAAGKIRKRKVTPKVADASRADRNTVVSTSAMSNGGTMTKSNLRG